MAAEATLFFSPEISKNEIRVEVHNVKINHPQTENWFRGKNCQLSLFTNIVVSYKKWLTWFLAAIRTWIIDQKRARFQENDTTQSNFRMFFRLYFKPIK